MFTGIVEAIGKVVALKHEGENLHLILSCPFTHELKIDQSVSHNGACLTVVEIKDSTYRVTAIAETLQKTNLGKLKVDDEVNLERSMLMNGRIDGHIVQGHVDSTAKCTKVEEQQGSWKYTFEYEPARERITVQKGSICVNGVSLTVVDSFDNSFSVAIIPYTFEHTNFHNLKPGDVVNLEFDVIGKYVARILEQQK